MLLKCQYEKHEEILGIIMDWIKTQEVLGWKSKYLKGGKMLRHIQSKKEG